MTLTPQNDDSLDRRVFWFASIIYMVFSLTMAAVSKGFLEGDACTHYLYARFSLNEPYLLLDVWGRPFCTALYAIPAILFKRMGVRALCAVLVVFTGWVCRKVARDLGFSRPSLAAILLYAQPLLFLHSFSELTEVPFIFLLALVLLAYNGKHWKTYALVIGLMPTARPEGFGFILLSILPLLYFNWKAIPLLVVPLMAWCVIGWADYGTPQPWWLEIPLWLKRHWPYSETSVYDKKNFFFLPFVLPGVLGPLVFIGLPVGIWRCLRSFPRNFRDVFSVAIVATALMVLIGHATLGALGKMGSNTEMRYLLTVSPLWAIAMAGGWSWIYERFPVRRPYLLIGALSLAPVVVNFGVYRIFPIRLNSEGKRSEEVAQWFRTNPYQADYDKTIFTVRGLNYELDISNTDPERSAEFKKDKILPDARGVLMVWDPIYGQYNSDFNRTLSAREIESAGWIPVKVFGNPEMASKNQGFLEKLNRDELKDWVVFLSPLTKEGRKTDKSLRVPLPANIEK